MSKYLSDLHHLFADQLFRELGVMARHVGVRMAENLCQHVDRHTVFDREAGERVPGAVGGQRLVDVADRGNFLQIRVHPLVAWNG